MRSDDQILYAYNNNKHIEGLEIRHLYELVGDPWNYLSTENVSSMDEYIELLSKSINFSELDTVVDYGCGIGVFSYRLKLKYPHLKIIGVDFDTAFAQSETLIEEKIFDDKYVLDEKSTEFSLLTLPIREGNGRTLVNFLNSSYYLFLTEDSETIESNLATLMTNLGGSQLQTVIISNSGFSYPRANAACKRLGMSSRAAQECKLDNSNPKFSTSLYIKIWNK